MHTLSAGASPFPSPPADTSSPADASTSSPVKECQNTKGAFCQNESAGCAVVEKGLSRTDLRVVRVRILGVVALGSARRGAGGWEEQMEANGRRRGADWTCGISACICTYNNMYMYMYMLTCCTCTSCCMLYNMYMYMDMYMLHVVVQLLYVHVRTFKGDVT